MIDEERAESARTERDENRTMVMTAKMIQNGCPPNVPSGELMKKAMGMRSRLSMGRQVTSVHM